MTDPKNESPRVVNVPVELADLDVIRDAARAEKRSIRSQCAFVLSQYAAEQSRTVPAAA